MLFRAVPQTGAKLRDLDHESVILANRVRTRRRWIIKGFSSLLLSAVVLVFVVILHRDGMTVDECLTSLDRPVAEFQAAVNELGQLPASLPDLPARCRLEVAPPIVREYAREAAGPVIIGSSPSIDLLLRADGNGVILYENGKVRCEWWPRVDFIRQYRAQAAQIRKWDERRQATLPQLP